MIIKVFSVLDSKAGFFGTPFFDAREGSAVRYFGDVVNKRIQVAPWQESWCAHPEDFQLFLVGEFDNETGGIKSDVPRALVNAASLVDAESKLPPVN